MVVVRGGGGGGGGGDDGGGGGGSGKLWSPGFILRGRWKVLVGVSGMTFTASCDKAQEFPRR